MSTTNYDDLLGLAESSLAVTAVVSTVLSTTLTDFFYIAKGRVVISLCKLVK